MKERWKDAEHLIRVALLFVCGLILFIVVRHFVVPTGFGQYGHYRPQALGEIAARPISFAGRDTCAMCHEDEFKMKQAGKHAGVGCEACHGALADHADDPSKLVPKKPDTAVLCVRCHEANTAKPKNFPQVNSKEHSGGAACGDCHKPHSPVIQ